MKAFLFFFFFFFFFSTCLAEAPSTTAQRIISEAEKFCTSFENGTFVAVDAVQTVDLTGNGGDEVVDESKFECSSFLSLYCGTGGCGLTILVGSLRKEFKFLAKGWTIETGSDGKPELETWVHWSECNYKTPCVQRHKWTGSSFKSFDAKFQDPKSVT
eukprot:gb/GEZN01013454.1/.p1 GENE.gb/GEZN01013454.1/~~gb/GEZN01013454.1/.p1  ORF type:complete len:158 (+),score=18.48 gb/GEZN01013454.1/:21-494(+)